MFENSTNNAIFAHEFQSALRLRVGEGDLLTAHSKTTRNAEKDPCCITNRTRCFYTKKKIKRHTEAHRILTIFYGILPFKLAAVTTMIKCVLHNVYTYTKHKEL
jgi:hypothetical protein